MITILASITGFISSILPEGLKIFRNYLYKKTSSKLLEQYYKIKKENIDSEIISMYIKKEIQEHNNLYATYKSDIFFIDALNASVRPVLAYGFFIIYILVKFLQYKYVMMLDYAPTNINLIWSLEDQAIFAGIISFYYGQRMFKNLSYR